MEIMEIAEMLGEALKNDERVMRLDECKKAYYTDPDLIKEMMEYEVQQKALSYEYEKPEKDMALIAEIQKKIDELYKSITENPVFNAFDAAQAEVNALMNEVNSKITATITGEDPSCTHDCSTCSGCH